MVLFLFPDSGEIPGMVTRERFRGGRCDTRCGYRCECEWMRIHGCDAIAIAIANVC